MDAAGNAAQAVPDPAAFLRNYWQRRPLLVRQALPGFLSPLSAEELAGLALEPAVESRLVLGNEARGWELRHGPFRESDFTGLPDDDWTLLVQDVEKHLPELAMVFDHFRFLPEWRMDDLMISHAGPGGSVGPHVDRYDVFLLQARGRRRWLIDTGPGTDLEERDAGGLRLLSCFRPTEEWVLEPGDMLYLPPGIPHHGIAEDDCQTWSIGLRAPELGELLAEVLQVTLERADRDALLTDAASSPTEMPGLLDMASLAAIRRRLRDALALDDSALDHCIAARITTPKPGFADKEGEQGLSAGKLRRRIGAGTAIRRNPASRLLLLETGGSLWLYVDGEPHALAEATAPLAHALAGRHRLSADALAPLIKENSALHLLLDLYNAGHCWLDTEGDHTPWT